MLVANKKKNMYNVSNRPYKLLANTRRGITQKVEPLETSSNREFVKCTPHVTMSMPRPVFHQVNGRPKPAQKTQENLPPQYDELIKYIHDTWTVIYKEYETSKISPDSSKVPKVVFYQDAGLNPHLADFEPFDLESFWGERFLQNIQQSA